MERLLDEMMSGSRANRKKGWYREKLGLRSPGTSHINTRERQQLYTEVLLLDQYFGDKATAAAKRMTKKKTYAKSKKIKSTKRKGLDPTSKRYVVCHAWGLGNAFEAILKQSMEDKREKDGPDVMLLVHAEGDDDDDKVIKTCIDDLEVATKFFTAKNMFIINELRRMAEDDLRFVTATEYQNRRATASNEFDKLNGDTKEYWKMRRRGHLLQHDHIAGRIADSLHRNPKRSWLGIEHDINYWCSASTIRRFLTTRVGYRLYAERIIPLLSAEQKQKHLHFARHF